MTDTSDKLRGKRQKLTVSMHKHGERPAAALEGIKCLLLLPLQHVSTAQIKPGQGAGMSTCSLHCWTLFQSPLPYLHLCCHPRALQTSHVRGPRRAAHTELGHTLSSSNKQLVFPPVLHGWHHSNHRLSSLAAIGGSQI